MIYFLFALLSFVAFGVWFIAYPTIPFLVPIILSAIFAAIAIGLAVYKRVKAKRSAAALESAIAEQGRQQAMNVGADKRADIDKLQKQISDGIGALKSSKLGGKQHGGSALYALPWYAIIGPPGAGKTTALKHSGLDFPYADGAIKGVGGTRNCDWWFTNDAILLDTAGRYTTEQSDQEEWFAFLDMLKKYRGSKPLNGLLVAISAEDLITFNEQQLEVMGKKLRARVDEVMTRLRMVLPVYFVLTKCDLIAGFTEFYGDLKKSARGQAWGTTLLLNEDKSDPGAIFAREFDMLVSNCHGRAIARLAYERNREAREALFHFPLEFAGIKQSLRELISQVFMVNAFQGTPILRGVYFTSGTQEGTPLNRVLARMGQAMGIQPHRQNQQPRVESKSYFLRDVFTKVVFPDADVAARSPAEIKRQRLVRLAISITAFTAAVLFAVPSMRSFFNNRELLDNGRKHAKKAMSIDWKAPTSIKAKIDKLKPIHKQLKVLDKWRTDGAPLGHRFLMYSGNKIDQDLRAIFIWNMQKGFVEPCKFHLEKKLNTIDGKKYADDRLMLKTYLMLSEVKHLDVEWATGRYTALWAQLQSATSDVSLVELKKQARPLIHYYFQLIKPGKDGKVLAKPWQHNAAIVKRAQKVLQSIPPRQRYYALFVDSLKHELYDPMDDAIGSNLQYPPLTLEQMFPDRRDLLQKWIFSKQKLGRVDKKKGYYEVEGPYTDKGHRAVLSNIKLAKQLLEREQWVVPLLPSETAAQVGRDVALTATDYEQRYINAWKGFLIDIEVKSPATPMEAIVLYKRLGKPPWPYARLLRRLHDNVMWNRQKLGGAASKMANRKLKTKIMAKTGLRVDVDVTKIAGRVSRIPAFFNKTVSFAVPLSGNNRPLSETPLAAYVQLLDRLRQRALDLTRENENAPPQALALDVRNGIRETVGMMKALDQEAAVMLLPLLQRPLNVGGKFRLSNPLLLR